MSVFYRVGTQLICIYDPIIHGIEMNFNLNSATLILYLSILIIIIAENLPCKCYLHGSIHFLYNTDIATMGCCLSQYHTRS